jgi:hypothetical protein
VPAELSSAIPTALTHLAHAEALQDAEAPHLLAYLATIRDPRARAGRRHPFVAILAMAAAAKPPAASRYHPRPPSAAPWPAWTRTPWRVRSARGWPIARVPTGGDGRSQWTA